MKNPYKDIERKLAKIIQKLERVQAKDGKCLEKSLDLAIRQLEILENNVALIAWEFDKNLH
jgi:hypothetical protein